MTEDWGTIEFLPTVRQISYGTGVASARIRAELEAINSERCLLLLPRSLDGSALLDSILAAIGDRLAAQVPGAYEHVPPVVVAATVRAARDCGADSIVALGGGSVIDSAKAVRFCLAAGITEARAFWDAVRRGAGAADGWISQISIPTTLSGAEATRSFSTTDRAREEKLSLTDSRAASVRILYDPAATLPTPMPLWLASGVMALDHAVEVFCAQAPARPGDLLKRDAVQTILHDLPITQLDASATAPRLRCQLAAWQADHSPLRTRPLASPGRALNSHALAYDFGAVVGLSYGTVACITLAGTLRWAARHAPGSGARQADLARHIGVASVSETNLEAAEQLAGAVGALIRELGLPASPSEAGLSQSDLQRVAASFLRRQAKGEVGAPQTEGEVLELLRDAPSRPPRPAPDLGQAFALGATRSSVSGLAIDRWQPDPRSLRILTDWCDRVGCLAVWTRKEGLRGTVTVFDFADQIEVVVSEQVAWNLGGLLDHVERAHADEAAAR